MGGEEGTEGEVDGEEGTEGEMGGEEGEGEMEGEGGEEMRGDSMCETSQQGRRNEDQQTRSVNSSSSSSWSPARLMEEETRVEVVDLTSVPGTAEKWATERVWLGLHTLHINKLHHLRACCL